MHGLAIDLHQVVYLLKLFLVFLVVLFVLVFWSHRGTNLLVLLGRRSSQDHGACAVGDDRPRRLCLFLTQGWTLRESHRGPRVVLLQFGKLRELEQLVG